MSRLRHRVARQPGAGAEAMEQWHPVAPHPMTEPLSLVTVSEDMIIVQEAAPMWAARGGAPIAATSPGHWDQVIAAGRA